MRSIADTVSYSDILGTIPALSSCTKEVLDEFAADDRLVRSPAGAELRSPTHAENSLYVVVAGSASLRTEDDLYIILEPGDYFGGIEARRYEHVIASAMALDDVEYLVIGPAQVLQLRHASTRRNHPSNIDWTPEPLSPSASFVPRRPRFSVLTNSAS
jgi:hypothetical protein